MNYSESQKILGEIEKADTILLNCHVRPDADSVGCALAMYMVLIKMDKRVKILSPDKLPENLKFLPYSEKVETVDFSTFNFSEYDLFVIQDTSVWERVSGSKDIPVPVIKKIIIDNHDTGDKFGDINFSDVETSSVCEMLYLIFEDWKETLTREISQCLLSGIISDTNVFEYSNVSPRTLSISGKLIEGGADKDLSVLHIFRSVDPGVFKFWSTVLSNMQIDKEHKFVWAQISFEDCKEFAGLSGLRSDTADLFFENVAGTNFGMLITEEENGDVRINLRARMPDFDVSKIALKIGGGGHKGASSAKLEGMKFEEAVEKILRVARENS